MMRAGQSTGYLLVTDPSGGDRERDTLTCSHCQRQVVIAPVTGSDTSAQRLDRCGQCHKTICTPCAAELTRTLKCAPWEARLDAIERRARLRKAAGV